MIERTSYSEIKNILSEESNRNFAHDYYVITSESFNAWYDYLDELDLKPAMISEDNLGYINGALFYSKKQDCYYGFLGYCRSIMQTLPW